MVNSQDVDASGDALHVQGHNEQKKYTSDSKGNINQRGYSKSKGPPGDLFCRYCKKKNHVIKNVENCRIRRRNDMFNPKGKTDSTVFVASNNISDNDNVLIAFVECAS
jgi:hypothetical protein